MGQGKEWKATHRSADYARELRQRKKDGTFKDERFKFNKYDSSQMNDEKWNQLEGMKIPREYEKLSGWFRTQGGEFTYYDVKKDEFGRLEATRADGSRYQLSPSIVRNKEIFRATKVD